MKIEIDIDIESIVREAIRNNAPTSNVIINTKPNNKSFSKGITWEFGPQPGRRRNTEEIALHELELKHGRLLTPEEKGEAKAFAEIDETAENKAKEETIKKVRIDTLTAEGMAAASKELAEEHGYTEEELQSGGYPENPTKKKPEATIPKTEDLSSMDSLFS